MGSCLCIIYAKFQGNRVSISGNFWKVSEKNLWPLETPFFFKSLLVYISGILREVFFIFEMWPLVSGGHHCCKLSAIQIKHNGATCVCKSQLCCSCQYTHSVCTSHWAARHTTVCFDCIFLQQCLLNYSCNGEAVMKGDHDHNDALELFSK